MNEILSTFVNIFAFAFVAIPHSWFLFVFPVMIFVGLITVIRRL